MNYQKQKLLPIFLLAIIILVNLFIFATPAFAQVSTPEPTWQGLVPCGRNSGTASEQAPCTLCHLIVGFQRLVQYGMYMVVTLALVGIFFAGVMYMVSSGDENMMTKAKTFLKVSLVGFAVVISSWLIVNVTMWVLGTRGSGDEGGVLGIKVEKWNKFTCDTKSSQGSGTVPTVQQENNKERDTVTPEVAETSNTQNGVANLPVLPLTGERRTSTEEGGDGDTSEGDTSSSLSANPSSIDLGRIPLAWTTAATNDPHKIPVTIRNNSSQDVRINSITTSSSLDWRSSDPENTCTSNSSLNSGDTCQLILAIAARDNGDFSGTANVSYGSNETLRVEVRGDLSTPRQGWEQ